MTGPGHTRVGVILSFAVFYNTYSISNTFFALVAAIIAIFGARAPDFLEIRQKSGGTKIPHRTITHYVAFWLVAFLSFDIILRLPYINSINPFMEIVLFGGYGFTFGALVHLACDLPNKQGIPFILPTSTKFSLNLFKSGKHESAMLAIATILTALYILWQLNILVVNI